MPSKRSETQADIQKRRKQETRSSTTTRSMAFKSLTAARNAVFSTTELLENILLHLPMKTLLLAQRTCLNWRDVIKRSKPLQQALFFKPREVKVFWKLDKKHEKLVKISKEEYSQGPSEEVFQSAIANPLLEALRSSPSGDAWFSCYEEAYEGLAGLVTFSAQSSAARPEASWRKMSVAQASRGPVDYSVILVRPKGPNGSEPISARIKTEFALSHPEETSAANVNAICQRVKKEIHEGTELEAVEDPLQGQVLAFEGALFMSEEDLEADELF